MALKKKIVKVNTNTATTPKLTEMTIHDKNGHIASVNIETKSQKKELEFANLMIKRKPYKNIRVFKRDDIQLEEPDENTLFMGKGYK